MTIFSWASAAPLTPNINAATNAAFVTSLVMKSLPLPLLGPSAD